MLKLNLRNNYYFFWKNYCLIKENKINLALSILLLYILNNIHFN